jgi:hypothetical protein
METTSCFSLVAESQQSRPALEPQQALRLLLGPSSGSSSGALSNPNAWTYPSEIARLVALPRSSCGNESHPIVQRRCLEWSRSELSAFGPYYGVANIDRAGFVHLMQAGGFFAIFGAVLCGLVGGSPEKDMETKVGRGGNARIVGPHLRP